MSADAIAKPADRPRYDHPGQPTKYQPEFCQRVLELGANGASKAEIAADIGVDRKTIDNWMNEHAEFFHAIGRAHELALVWWEQQGRAGIASRDFNANAFKFQVINRFRDDYVSERSEVELSGPGGEPLMPAIVIGISGAEPVQQLSRLQTIEAKPLTQQEDVATPTPATRWIDGVNYKENNEK